MKKTLRIVIIWIFVFAVIIAFLNINVTTRKGINFRVFTIKIPLYLKILDFFDRHYNCKQLVNALIAGKKGKEERVKELFDWTYNNISRQPENLSVVDDHVWHIIIRGYGVSDQFSDVFTTLCNYAGIDAFFAFVYTKDRSSRIPFSFVRLDKKWRVFDPYNGVYFINNHGSIASIEEINIGNWQIKSLVPAVKDHLNYKLYLANLPVITGAGVLNRANIQSPFRRIMYEIRKLIKLK